MIVLKGLDFSTPSNKVRFVLHYLDVDYRYDQVNLMKGEGQNPEYLKLNPSGKVPTLLDGDFSVWESNAIIKYLARRQASSIYPSDFQKQAIVDQWMDFASMHMMAAISKIQFNKLLAPMMGKPVDMNSWEEGKSFLKRFLPIVDAQLGKNAYLAGSELTLADFVMLSALDPAEVLDVDLSVYPNVAKWRGNLQKQPFYKKCYNSYADVLAVGKV